MSWSFLTRLQEEIHNHGTFVGKMGLTVLVAFRIILTAVCAESIYYDEQSNFMCNTQHPGCVAACYNAFSPFSYVRFLVFQIVLVAMPSLMYVGYVSNKIARSEKGKQADPMTHDSTDVERQNDSLNPDVEGSDTKTRIKQDGLMVVYVLQLVARFVLEIFFLICQSILYGFAIPGQYECSTEPCHHKVNCFIPYSTEKTIFLLIMYGMTALCILFNICEMVHHGLRLANDNRRGYTPCQTSQEPTESR